jgi:hypothetical protein
MGIHVYALGWAFIYVCLSGRSCMFVRVGVHVCVRVDIHVCYSGHSCWCARVEIHVCVLG